MKTFVHDRERRLWLMFNASQSKLVFQTELIDALEQPRSEFTMNLDGRSDHFSGEWVTRFHFQLLLLFSVPLCLCGSILRHEKMLLPLIDAGTGWPNSARIDGAMSMSDGFFARNGLLHHSTPGTSSASAQWSALHAAVLPRHKSGVRSATPVPTGTPPTTKDIRPHSR